MRRLALVAALSTGCGQPAPTPARPQRASSQSDDVLGEQVYLEHCARCHGIDGTGSGPDGLALRPPPRSFVEARFEYKSTPGDELPTDADLERTVAQGVLDEGMPAFPQLDDDERAAVVQYLKHFSPRWAAQ